MKSSFALLLLLIIASPMLVAQENNWITSKDLELGYRIDFPEKVDSNKSQSIPTAKGNVDMISYMLNSSNTSNLIYMSSFTKYPLSFFPDGLDTLEKQTTVLDQSVNGAVTNVKGKLVSDTKIVFNGYNGRVIKIGLESVGVQYIIRIKTILVNYKLYIIQTISKKEYDDNLDTKRFFDSFELINVKQ